MRIAFLIGLLSQVLLLNAQRFDFTQFSTPEGLAQPGVYDIISDSTGYLYVATENGGLLKFDGSRFEVLGQEHGLAEASVRVLYFDKLNQLWFGTEKNGLGKLGLEGIKLFDQNDGLPQLHFRAIVENVDGLMYVASLDGRIFSGENGNWTELSLPDSLNIGSFRAACRDAENSLWFATDKGVLRIKGEKLTFYMPEHGLADADVLCLYYDANNGLLAGTQTGAYQFRDTAWKAISHTKLIGKRIRSISGDAIGGIWFGSNNGLLRIELDRDSILYAEIFTENNGLANNRIRKIYRDHSNTMWFGTFFGGLCRLCDLSVCRFDARSGWPDNIVTAIEEGDDGTMFLGTFEGNVYKVQVQNSQRIFSNENGQESKINDLYFDETGLLIATPDGLWKVKDNGFTEKIPGISKVDLIAEFGKNQVYVTGNSDLIHLDSQKKYSFERFQSGWNDALEWNKMLVLAGSDGLLMLDSLLNPVQVPQDLQNISINDIAVDPAGNLWMATQLKGLLRYDGQNTESFRSKSYLPDPRIKSVQADDNYNLWIATAKGLVRWEMDPDFQIVLDQEFIENHDGLKNAVCIERAIFGASDNTLWLGTMGGMFRINPGKKFTDNSAPKVLLQGIDLRYEPVRWDTLGFETDSINIPQKPVFLHYQNHLTFRWTAIETGNDNPVMYEYRLIGIDSTWSFPRTEPYVTFTALPPGDYELQVRAKSRDNFWSELPLKYKFTISTPWYKKLWVIVMAIVLLGTIIWLFVRFRLMMLKRENLKLEEKVQERTFELEEEKKKSDELLLNILPEETAEELKREGSAKPRKYKEVSVLFSDFKGFTQLTESMSSKELVASLDECFRAFDRHTSDFKVEKIKTIGDAYMCATGLPQEDPEHAKNLVKFALAMLEEMEVINSRRARDGEPQWQVRIGIHSGPVVAGVVGEKKFAFDIWGDTVNTASRMESSGKPGKINVSSATFELVKDFFEVKARGKVEAKNKGELEMYFIKSLK